MGYNEPTTLLEIGGFNARFEDYLPKAESKREAYEKTEADVEKEYNHRQYKNYESFNSARKRWLNRKLKSNRWNSKRGFGRTA